MIQLHSSNIYHHTIDHRESSHVYVWESESLLFDEMLISWNSFRPVFGDFLISCSVKTECWSQWHLYSSWGASGQFGGNAEALEASMRIVKDTVEVLCGKIATAFRIRIEAVNGAALKLFRSLHVYANLKQALTKDSCAVSSSNFSSINLSVPLISQIALFHERSRSLCSPVSTLSVVNYLINEMSSEQQKMDPIQFALNVKDMTHDIFGNWVLNIAHASFLLGPAWHCWVQKLQGFEEIYEQLKLQIPVVVSIRGPLKGAALPYTEGHLIVVKGFDSKNCRVLCMDPGFPTDEETDFSYDFEDFMQAWRRRGYIAYMFRPR